MSNEIDAGKAASMDAFHGLRGTNQSGMRAYNERLVLSILRRRGALAKTDIARMTGLSAQTVSVIMRSLEADGFLRRGEPIRGKVGQPSIPMSLSEDGAYFFGLKIGRRSADLVLIDFVGNIIASTRRTYRYPTPDTAVQFARTGLQKLYSKVGKEQRKRIGGLGIAIPFQLWNWAQFVGAPQKEMDAWRDRDIQSEIADACDVPVYLQNDATSACGAEVVFGTGPKPRDFLYIYVGFLVGGGIVLNGGLYTGRSGNAGALGPMPVPSKNGRSRQLIEAASIGTLEQMLSESGCGAEIWDSPDHWNVDQSVLKKWIMEVGGALSHAIVSASSVIDFEATVIDGWLPTDIRSEIIAETGRSLGQLDLAGINPPKILAGSVGPNARSLGAASLPLSKRYLVEQNALG